MTLLLLLLSHFSCVWFFATLWTVACQAPLSMGFFRKTHWSGLPFPPPEDLPNRGTEPASLSSPALAAAAAAKALQSCPTLCDPRGGSPPGSPVPGILQARTLEWAAISFSNAWKRKVKVKSLCCVRLLATPWTAAYQAPPSMDFPGKSTGVGCHCLLQVHCKLESSYHLPQLEKAHMEQWRSSADKDKFIFK